MQSDLTIFIIDNIYYGKITYPLSKYAPYSIVHIRKKENLYFTREYEI